MRKKINIRRDVDSRNNIARTTHSTIHEGAGRKTEKPVSDEIKQTEAKEADPPGHAPAAKAKKGGRETEGNA